MSTAVRYVSYAKVNLYLEVLNRRDDGYHNIETIFQSVGLADELVFTEQPQDIRLTCSMRELENGGGNLAHRAAELLRERTGRRNGVHIHIEKRIPVAAGMAGGSGNAAAALVALNELWELGLSKDELRALGLELGSDVPFCIGGGTAAAAGRGELLEPLAPLAATWFVLVHPEIAVSASRVYNSALLQHSDQAPVDGKTPAFRRAIGDLAAPDWRALIFNRMESVVFADHPHLAEVRDRLAAAGCAAAAMSGSGPTIFGVCGTKHEAQRVAGTFGDYQVSVVQSVPVGVERTQ